MKKISTLTFFLVFLVFCTSCALRKPATSITADILKRGMVEVESEEDVFVARETALPLLKILEVLHNGNPKNKKFLGLLARAYGNYAFGFAELEMLKTTTQQNSNTAAQTSHNEWYNRIRRFYVKGMNYGIASLSKGRQSLAEIPLNQLDKSLKKFGKKDIETLFWTAFNWGSYINMSRDDITIAADLPRVQAIVERVIEINPDFTCGVAYAFKGALLAGNPLLTGSKPEIAKPYFDKAVANCNGSYLMGKVMYAEWYLTATGNKQEYKKVLEEVISSDATSLPQYRLANELAKERAKLL